MDSSFNLVSNCVFVQSSNLTRDFHVTRYFSSTLNIDVTHHAKHDSSRGPGGPRRPRIVHDVRSCRDSTGRSGCPRAGFVGDRGSTTSIVEGCGWPTVGVGPTVARNTPRSVQDAMSEVEEVVPGALRSRNDQSPNEDVPHIESRRRLSLI